MIAVRLESTYFPNAGCTLEEHSSPHGFTVRLTDNCLDRWKNYSVYGDPFLPNYLREGIQYEIRVGVSWWERRDDGRAYRTMPYYSSLEVIAIPDHPPRPPPTPEPVLPTPTPAPSEPDGTTKQLDRLHEDLILILEELWLMRADMQETEE